MSENSESYYDFIHPKSAGPEGFLFEVYTNSGQHAVARDTLQSALGDVPRFCNHCGGFCDAHVIALRDAFFKKARELSERLSKAVDIYFVERDLGILEPEQLMFRLFETWNKLSVLYALSEPQDYMDPAVDEVEEEQNEEE